MVFEYLVELLAVVSKKLSTVIFGGKRREESGGMTDKDLTLHLIVSASPWRCQNVLA